MCDTAVVMISWSPNPKRLRALEVCFQSLKQATHYPHILAVVDNGPAEQTQWLRQQEIDLHIVNEVNQGIGVSRNQGARATDTEYLAFVDSDLAFFDGWLGQCIEALKRYPDQKLIATGRFEPSHGKYFRRPLNEYQLYGRAAGGCLVMRRETWKKFGQWPTGRNTGDMWSRRAVRRKYLFIWHPSWRVRHLVPVKSYGTHQRLVNGKWIREVSHVHSA